MQLSAADAQVAFEHVFPQILIMSPRLLRTAMDPHSQKLVTGLVTGNASDSRDQAPNDEPHRGSRTSTGSVTRSVTRPVTKRRKSKRRAHSPHPGVVILEPDTRTGAGYRARWDNPEPGAAVKTLTVSFAKLGITTTEGRVTWARGKADELAARTKALQSGATPRLDMPIAAALEKYFELVAPTGNPDIDDIRPETVLIYRAAARCFAEWCVANKAPTAGAVSEWHLQHWRASRITAKHERTGKARSRFSARKEVAAMRTILLHLRKVKIVALSKEQINDGLNNVEAKAKKKGFLYPDDIKLLLEAADAHDADVASRPAAGNRTIRFAALGAFVRVVLFTGARVNEIITLEWRDVDLQHGKIHLRPENVKTGDARTVDLLICPSVVALLKALRAKLAGAEPTARVFPSATTERAQCARQRLIKHHKAPTFSWHMLRRTTGTYLTCAPSIFGAASAWMSSQRLGHGVGVAESSYVGRVDVPASARTLEQAFGLAP